MAGGETNSTTGGSDAPLTERRFATNAVHAGTQHAVSYTHLTLPTSDLV